MRKLIFIPILIVAVLFNSSCNKQPETADEMVALAKESVTTISPDELFDIMSGEEVYTLIDVRSPLEHYPGYIAGSVLLSRGSLEFQIGKESFWEEAGLYMPLKDEIIIVYCRKGSRGILAAKTLEQMGYKKVYTLDGGFKAWELAYPDYTEKNLDALGGSPSTHDMGGGC